MILPGIKPLPCDAKFHREDLFYVESKNKKRKEMQKHELLTR